MYGQKVTAQLSSASYAGRLSILVFNALIAISFYGINSILLSVLKDGYGYSDGFASFCTSAYICFTYICALLGAALADFHVGKFRVILAGGVFFLLGIIVCLVSTVVTLQNAEYLFFAGLFISALGNGCVIPCISAFAGDQFDEELPQDKEDRSVFFSWLYLSTQIGSIVATFSSPLLVNYISHWAVFGALGAALFVGVPLFALLHSQYVKLPPDDSKWYLTVVGIFKNALSCSSSPYDMHLASVDYRCLNHAVGKRRVAGSGYYAFDEVEDVKSVLRVLEIFLAMPFFWAMYFQIFTLWILQAEQMDLKLPLVGWSVPASEITVLNPFFDLFLIPLFAKAIYPGLERMSLGIGPLTRMGLGLGTTVTALVVAFVLQLVMDAGHPNTVSVVWIVPQMFLISCAEILLSITCLEFAYTQAPASMKGTVSACWYLTLALGNMMVGVIGLISSDNLALDFLLFAIGITLILGLFSGIAIRYHFVHLQIRQLLASNLQ